MSDRTQLDDEVVQLGLRHQRLHIVPAGPCLALGIAQYLAAPAGQQALRGGGDSLGMLTVTWLIGSSSTGSAFGKASVIAMRVAVGTPCPSCRRSGTAVHQRDLEIDDGIAERAPCAPPPRPLRRRRGCSCAAPRRPRCGRRSGSPRRAERRDLQLDVGELAVAAGLALQARMLVDRLADRLAERHQRPLRGDRNAVARRPAARPRCADGSRPGRPAPSRGFRHCSSASEGSSSVSLRSAAES